MAAPATDRKVVFVTGGAFGIGHAVAMALAGDGFDVAVSGTKAGNVANTCAKLEAAGVRALEVVLDVRSNDSVTAAFEAVTAKLGRVDVLVNNAGIPVNKEALEITPAEWENIVATNLNGTFYASQAMARHLIGRKAEGLIINIGSTHGIVAFPKRSAYGVSKAGVMHMTKMLAIEWAPHGVRVNAVAPGRVNSDSPGRLATLSDPAYLEVARKRIPLGRFCSVEDVAEAVRYLASPGAAYITGHTLVLDGGVTVA
jgi:NAD(P)-dependent dehydrogenase (short-subunit alcohol dehydrogenase family)